MSKVRRILFFDRKIFVPSLESYCRVVYSRTQDDAVKKLSTQSFNEVWFTAKNHVPNKLVSYLESIGDGADRKIDECVVVTSDTGISDEVHSRLGDMYKIKKAFLRPDEIY